MRLPSRSTAINTAIGWATIAHFGSFVSLLGCACVLVLQHPAIVLWKGRYRYGLLVLIQSPCAFWNAEVWRFVWVSFTCLIWSFSFFTFYSYASCGALLGGVSMRAFKFQNPPSRIFLNLLGKAKARAGKLTATIRGLCHPDFKPRRWKNLGAMFPITARDFEATAH